MPSHAPWLLAASPKEVAVQTMVPVEESFVMERYETEDMVWYPTTRNSEVDGSWVQALAASLPTMPDFQCQLRALADVNLMAKPALFR